MFHRFLTTSDAMQTIAFSFCLGNATVQQIVYQVCEALWNSLQEQYLPAPTMETWIRNADQFWEKLNFPNVVGALDGKHICIQVPVNSESAYFNYKEFFSIVLLAIVDADYKFVLVDISECGSQADSAVFHNSSFGQAFISGDLPLPLPKQLPNYSDAGSVPMFLLGNAAFPLHEDLMKPYSNPRKGQLEPAEKIFNYRCLVPEELLKMHLAF